MIDFKELPQDGVKFEQLIRELLVREGFETHWTGVGTDGGRDLVVTEKLKGELSEYKRKWLISCKHTANSGRSLGREDAGNISEDCRAIGAEGYILVCSTQPTASLVNRLEEITQNQKIITKFWDSIEIEKRLLKANTFGLIHTFFPESSKNYKWRVYNAYSPGFWAANYKNYFFYLCCRLSNMYPDLKGIETIVSIMEAVPIHKDPEYYLNSHHLRLRAVYYNDKYSEHIIYIDYIYPSWEDKKLIINPIKLEEMLEIAFKEREYYVMNSPIWDIPYIPEYIVSDSFDIDHKKYYEPYLTEFDRGGTRNGFLHDIVFFQKEMGNNG